MTAIDCLTCGFVHGADTPHEHVELPWSDGSTATRNGAVGRGKCRRHEWVRHEVDISSFDECSRCGAVRDPAASRRGRVSSNRGKKIQRQRIEGLGGRNLAGNNPNLDGIGEMFRYESKSGQSFPERPWRWLKGIAVPAGQIGVLIITDAPGRGHKARSVVLVDYDDWQELHGETPK